MKVRHQKMNNEIHIFLPLTHLSQLEENVYVYVYVYVCMYVCVYV